MTTFDTRRLAPASSLAQKSLASSVPAVCFGVGCSDHGACARYWAADGSDPEGPRMARCSTNMDRPGFVLWIAPVL